MPSQRKLVAVVPQNLVLANDFFFWNDRQGCFVLERLTLGSARSARLQLAPHLRDANVRWYAEGMRREPVRSEPPFAGQLLAQAGALYSFARYLCRDSAQAEDLVQDAFARALDAQSSFVLGTNLKAWLFRILRNAFLDAKRRQRKNPLTAHEESDLEAAVSDEWLRGDIEIDCLRGLVARDIEAALNRLSDDGRSVILLDLEGFTETEIAGVMDTAVGTVKSRLARARAALREELKEYAK
jgi:RNA polymerase sigma-70 factor, ECF subfamily